MSTIVAIFVLSAAATAGGWLLYSHYYSFPNNKTRLISKLKRAHWVFVTNNNCPVCIRQQAELQDAHEQLPTIVFSKELAAGKQIMKWVDDTTPREQKRLLYFPMWIQYNSDKKTDRQIRQIERGFKDEKGLQDLLDKSLL